MPYNARFAQQASNALQAAYLLFTALALVWALQSTAQSYPEHNVTSDIKFRAGLAGGPPDATALSISGALSCHSIWDEHWFSTLEGLAVASDSSHYFDGVTDNGFAKIPDADGLNLTGATIGFSGLDYELALGRQKVRLLEGRLIGTNGFWQKPQVFDAFRFEQAIGGQLNLDIHYLWAANRIGGHKAKTTLHRDDIRFEQLNGVRPISELGRHTLNSWALEAIWRHEQSTISLITLNHDNRDIDSHDSLTGGFRYNTASRHYGLKFNLRVVALAQKRLHQKIPYYDLRLDLNHRMAGFKFQRETLGASNGVAFVTPLASLHDFQGMTDQFLVTPPSGLHDSNISVLLRNSLLGTLTGEAHYFEEYSGSKLGKEFGVEWSKTFGSSLKANLRAGHFTGNNESDVWRFFITIEHKSELQ